jgi:8-oxo-dGTP pyrophosphatase MutT (NUDIX family)
MVRAVQEFSSGGVVIHKNSVLLIRTKTLRNKKIWTFPKGHIEKDEIAPMAAVREVEEETGYKCIALKPIASVQYCFTSRSRLIKKDVQWFLMKKIMKKGKPDAIEILDVKWFNFENAMSLLEYPSDKDILNSAITMAKKQKEISGDYSSLDVM